MGVCVEGEGTRGERQPKLFTSPAQLHGSFLIIHCQRITRKLHPSARDKSSFLGVSKVEKLKSVLS